MYKHYFYLLNSIIEAPPKAYFLPKSGKTGIFLSVKK